jgi:hypothetical protein
MPWIVYNRIASMTHYIQLYRARKRIDAWGYIPRNADAPMISGRLPYFSANTNYNKKNSMDHKLD